MEASIAKQQQQKLTLQSMASMAIFDLLRAVRATTVSHTASGPVLTVEHRRQVFEHFWFNHLTTPCCLNSVQTPSEHAVGTLFERMCSASGSEQAILERFWAILSIFEPAGGHQKCSNTSSAWCWNTLFNHLPRLLLARSTTSLEHCRNQVFNHRSTGRTGPLHTARRPTELN